MWAGVIWIWRRFFAAGDMTFTQLGLLLFRIRAIPKPRFGNWPWLASLPASCPGGLFAFAMGRKVLR
jgi:hypothetical protein